MIQYRQATISGNQKINPRMTQTQQIAFGFSVMVPLMSTIPGDGCVKVITANTSHTKAKVKLFVPFCT